MPISRSSSWIAPLILSVLLARTAANGDHHLSVSYYDRTCPSAQHIVRSVMASKVAAYPRMAPAVLRLFFHDCFVNGCDGSVLLDTPFVEDEKEAEPNDNSLRGFDVVDEIKSHLEHDCPATVSCADILALASRDAVALLGGPAWNVPLGRKDSREANATAAIDYLPSPHDRFSDLLAAFGKHGLDARDMAALSGAHTVGTARCVHYKDRVYGYNGEGGDDDVDPSFAELRRQTCRAGDDAEAPFDELTPMRFDNAYYKDLVARRGLLTSDQALYGSGGPVDHLVKMYSRDGEAFARDFARAMVKMGNIPPPPGMPVEVRLDCKKVNY